MIEKNLFLSSKTYRVVLNDIKNKMSNHAYMIITADSYRASLYAKLVAKMFLCEKSDIPCGECLSCQKIEHNNHADVFYYPKGDRLTVEESRKIVNDSYIIPLEAEKKIYIIENFDKATIQAQNALLKTLEEPPKYVVFILTVANENLVVNTVKSRSKKIIEPLLDEKIEKQALEELKIRDLSGVLYNSGGILGTALELSKNKNLNKILDLVIDIFKSMKNSSNVLKYSSEFLKYKEDYSLILELMLQTVQNIMYAKVDANLVQGKEYSTDFIKMANEYSYSTLSGIAEKIIFAKKMLESNCNPTSTVDNLLMSILEVKYYAKGC